MSCLNCTDISNRLQSDPTVTLRKRKKTSKVTETKASEIPKVVEGENQESEIATSDSYITKKGSQSDTVTSRKRKKVSANLEACNPAAREIFHKKTMEMQSKINKLREQLEEHKRSKVKCYTQIRI